MMKRDYREQPAGVKSQVVHCDACGATLPHGETTCPACGTARRPKMVERLERK